MGGLNNKLDLSTLKQMKHILDQVSINCCDSGGVLDEIDEVIEMLREWIEELEDDS